MSCQTEDEARELLDKCAYHLSTFPDAATRIHIIDGIIFSFMLERGLASATASAIPLLSPRIKLDQLTRLVDAINLHHDDKSPRDLARFVAATRPLDRDLPNALARVCNSEEYGHELEQVAGACHAAMARERVGGDWTLDEVAAALTAEVDDFWAGEAARCEWERRRPGFNRAYKFELQAIFDDEDRACGEEQAEKRRAAEELQLQRQQMELHMFMLWQQEQQRLFLLQMQDRLQGGQQGGGQGG